MWRPIRLACAWLGATAFTLVVAHKTSVGPVVLKISSTHGIHRGDALAGIAAATAAALYSAIELRSSARR